MMIPNFEVLDRMVLDVENVDKTLFRMDLWMNECGTVGCLVGTFAKGEYQRTGAYPIWLRDSHNSMERGINDKILCMYLGITLNEFHWLFTNCPNFATHEHRWLPNIGQHRRITHLKPRVLFETSKDAALKRLKLFVAYKKLKRQILPSRDTKESREQYDIARNTGSLELALST